MKLPLLTALFFLAITSVAEAEMLRLRPPRPQFLNEQLQEKAHRSTMSRVQKMRPDRSKMHHVSRPDPRKLNPGRGKRIERKREETHTAAPVQPVYRGENY